MHAMKAGCRLDHLLYDGYLFEGVNFVYQIATFDFKLFRKFIAKTMCGMIRLCSWCEILIIDQSDLWRIVAYANYQRGKQPMVGYICYCPFFYNHG